jgi:hypothetical protein
MEVPQEQLIPEEVTGLCDVIGKVISVCKRSLM